MMAGIIVIMSSGLGIIITNDERHRQTGEKQKDK
jgi:hypothetical protein